jgi:hypothetical protein
VHEHMSMLLQITNSNYKAQSKIKIKIKINKQLTLNIQPRFKENSTWQIPKFEVFTTRGLAWTRFPEVRVMNIYKKLLL